ncbi:Serine/threonine protein phosphatase 2A 57 kDa regulatory subunit B' beta isoform [Acorus calamus]|uniref:Serine/threonine protein phosphatase 2A 57 kDa regulatory subunit B' beta isoform n=1 Tax=Acorus calamus TaxID=4465 RepID=A0AAV9DX04_ACOCL|nr:Serine/threonine protein phosphatase 2A 57 kDa regulatory subunit B' beta isoform [Acorus calamus]
MGSPRTATRRLPEKKRPTTTLQRLFELDSITNSTQTTSATASETETEELLSLITHCTHSIFTFTDPSECPSHQDLKRHKLSQILSVVRLRKNHEPNVVSALVKMVSANLFRPLPAPLASNPCSVAMSDPSLDDDASAPAAVPVPAWPHLYFVYDILTSLVKNCDAKVLRAHVDRAFLSGVLALFQSEDPRERERLKNVYHQLYSRFTPDRSFMRKAMNDVFFQYVFETERHVGVGELLEIWGSIINGFTVPLKEEHKLFLTRVLVPLHKPKGMHAYHRQLAYCVCQFVTKEPALAGVVVRGILKYWPVTNCQKEVLIIGELEELVEVLQPEQFGELALPICSQIAKCLNSWNSQVAERALYVWNNEQFVKMATQSMEEVMPAVVEGIEDNMRCHWSKSVRQLTENVKRMLEEMEPAMYEKCLEELRRREQESRQEEMKRMDKWERLLRMASASQLACVSH